jgi:hypothetical protein
MDADLSVRIGSIQGQGRALVVLALRFIPVTANRKAMNALTRWDLKPKRIA